MIVLQGLTKRFLNGRGIFELSFKISEGEVFGYLGPNGAGKSTTIRHLMGFLRQNSGTAHINNLDCWAHADKVQENAGYLPGEIGFLEGMTGIEFLNLLVDMRKLRKLDRRNELINRFELDAKTPIHKMSKGTKQKVGIIAAFMHRPSTLILDEPTSGLDPLMQQRFLDLILEEKRQGTTILMSSHIFSEVERVCDRVGIIKDGRLVIIQDVKSLRQVQRKVFSVTVEDIADKTKLESMGCHIVHQHDNRLDIEVKGNYNEFIKALASCDIRALDIHQQDLEQVFMHFYNTEEGSLK